MRLGTATASRGKIGIGRIGLRQVRDLPEARAFIGLDKWCDWLNDRDVREHLESTGEWTPARLEKWIHEHGARTIKLYVIKVDHQAVGTLKLDHVEPGGWPSLGLMIGDKTMWGKGVGSGAIEKACRIAKRAGCAGVWAGIRTKNQASIRAFERARFLHWSGTEPMIYAAVSRWPNDGIQRVVLVRAFR